MLILFFCFLVASHQIWFPPCEAEKDICYDETCRKLVYFCIRLMVLGRTDWFAVLQMLKVKGVKVAPRQIAQQIIQNLPQNNIVLKTEIAGPGNQTERRRCCSSFEVLPVMLPCGQTFSQGSSTSTWTRSLCPNSWAECWLTECSPPRRPGRRLVTLTRSSRSSRSRDLRPQNRFLILKI